MRTSNAAFIAVLAASLLWGCGQSGSDKTMMELIHERDSLRQENQEQCERLTSINRLMTTINLAVDSIAESEGLLFINPDGEGRISRDNALNQLNNYEMLIKRQQQELRDMRLRLGEDNKDVDGIIKVMKQQLDAKDKMIEQLRAQLAQKDIDINRLKATISNQRITIDEQQRTIVSLGESNDRKTRALQVQDNMLNQGFIIMKSRKELENLGIIRKGKIVPDGTLRNVSAFMKIDIRKAREFAFQAKKPKILSDMPASSYDLRTTGDGNFTITITDPTAFWSISNYLVIQTF